MCFLYEHSELLFGVAAITHDVVHKPFGLWLQFPKSKGYFGLSWLFIKNVDLRYSQVREKDVLVGKLGDGQRLSEENGMTMLGLVDFYPFRLENSILGMFRFLDQREDFIMDMRSSFDIRIRLCKLRNFGKGGKASGQTKGGSFCNTSQEFSAQQTLSPTDRPNRDFVFQQLIEDEADGFEYGKPEDSCDSCQTSERTPKKLSEEQPQRPVQPDGDPTPSSKEIPEVQKSGRKGRRRRPRGKPGQRASADSGCLSVSYYQPK